MKATGTVGHCVRDARLRRGLSLREVAAMVPMLRDRGHGGVLSGEVYLGEIERGKRPLESEVRSALEAVWVGLRDSLAALGDATSRR